MWLSLDLEGIGFRFRIRNYRQYSAEEILNYENWTRIDLSLQAGEWLNYHVTNDEIMMTNEIEDLRDHLELLLTDGLTEEYRLELLEPDFVFALHPKEDVRNNPTIVYVRPGHEIVDIDVDMEIAFWHEGLTANRLILSFDREEINALWLYLCMISGTIDKQDSSIQALSVSGYLSDD